MKHARQNRSAATYHSASPPPPSLSQYLITALVLVNVMIAVLLDKVILMTHSTAVRSALPPCRGAGGYSRV